MSRVLSSLPVNDGFFMPSEVYPQQEVWMAWPERTDSWRLNAEPAQQSFCQLACIIAECTPVVMVVSAQQYNQARAALPDHINVVEMLYDDCWMRDIGATYLINHSGERRGVSWQFNAWGGLVDGLYHPWDNDNKVAEKMLAITRDDIYIAPFVLEGGAIHTDGDGTLYTTEECLLHPSRNPELSKPEIENNLKNYLGVEKIIWLPKGVHPCDETNGHVDNVLHVARPGEVLLSVWEDKIDPQFEVSQQTLELLRSSRDAKGRQIKVYELPTPGPLFRTGKESEGIDHSANMQRGAGEQLAGSYANFLITNSAIIFPLLDVAKDEQAKQVLIDAFPDHKVVGVAGREILLGGGNIHCITQNVPVVG